MHPRSPAALALEAAHILRHGDGDRPIVVDPRPVAEADLDLIAEGLNEFLPSPADLAACGNPFGDVACLPCFPTERE